MARVTLQSIADRLGVSRMTVSNAFSRPDQLSAELREQILAVADELGYAGPDPSARSLATGTTGTVGVLWTVRLRHGWTDEVAARFLGAIADELTADGLALTLIPANVDGVVVPARDVAVDGAIAYSCSPAEPALGWLERRGLPLVYVDLPAPRGSASVTIDDRGGARQAAAHLLELGHRRIATVSFQDPPHGSSPVIAERRAGWQEALLAAGVTPREVLLADETADARPALTRLLAAPDRPTAVLCLTDVLAHDVVTTATALGLEVPGRLSVVGFDDNPLAGRSHPALTTVRQDVEAKGRAAVRALRAAIAGHRGIAGPAPEDARLGVSLVVRESTGPVPRPGR